MALINSPPNSPVDVMANGSLTMAAPEWRGFFMQAFSLLVGLTQSGTTAQRPTSMLWTGRPYFDSTLDAPIFWDGTAWVRGGLAGYKVGSFTRDLSLASGSQAVTGVGFSPRLLVFGGATAAGSIGGSVGASDGTTNAVVQLTTGGFFSNAAFCIYVAPAALGDFNIATVASLDADGFTLAWTQGGAPVGTATNWYVALR